MGKQCLVSVENCAHLREPSRPKAGTRAQTSKLFFLRQPSTGCLPGVPQLGELFLLNSVWVRAACQGVSCIPRDQSRGPRMRHPGAQKQSEGTRQQHTGGFCSEEKLLPGQGQHTFVLLPGILAFFFQNNGGVCAPCEGKTGEQCCCAAPSQDNARGHACHP